MRLFYSAGCVAWVLGLPLMAFAAAEGDPLLSRMEGTWQARGMRRNFSISSGTELSRAPVEAEVQSKLKTELGVLVSRNRVQEGMPGTPQFRSYLKTYWIRPTTETLADGTIRVYELGGGDPQPGQVLRPSIRGEFDGKQFVVLQDVPVQPPMSVLTVSEFVSDGLTQMVELTRMGEIPTSEVKLEYRRVSP